MRTIERVNVYKLCYHPVHLKVFALIIIIELSSSSPQPPLPPLPLPPSISTWSSETDKWQCDMNTHIWNMCERWINQSINREKKENKTKLKSASFSNNFVVVVFFGHPNNELVIPFFFHRLRAGVRLTSSSTYVMNYYRVTIEQQKKNNNNSIPNFSSSSSSFDEIDWYRIAL